MKMFSEHWRAIFATHYPEIPHKLRHSLAAHPLMELESLACLGERLPPQSVESNRADLPIGVDGKPEPASIPIGDMIRNIATAGSWAVLKNIEQDPVYARLLADVLEDLRPGIEARTGPMMATQGFVFITSPGGVTPYHFDPEHNVLLQLRGSKVITQFPAGQTAYAPDEAHERYHTGGGRELAWQEAMQGDGTEFQLDPGDAVYVPVMAPHFVRNGPAPSISLSVTWRSRWSFAEADARVFNGMLRRIGIKPAGTGRWPARNLMKAYGWRVLRRLGAAHWE